jgi:hypothetical protein
MQSVTKFELLPNKIMIECFGYLNAWDIFYSFYRLNYRFDKLIQKTIFDQFCTTMLSNSEIKRQIYSLRLSNDDTCGQIQAFLSFFKFHQLQI